MIATEPRRLRRALTTATLALLTLPLTACLSAPTDFVYTPAQGVNDRDGEVDVLNALIVSTGEGEGQFVVGLANGDREQGDELVGVTGAGEDSGVQVQLAGGETAIEPGGFLQTADPDSATIVVTGDDVRPGTFVRLSLQFAQAEAVEVHVPVVEAGDDFADVTSGSASPTESATEQPEPATAEETPSE